MKKLLIHTITAIGIFALIYLILAFVIIEIDFRKWGTEYRFAVVYIWAILEIIAFVKIQSTTP